MKSFLKKCALYILRGTMSFIYFFIKLFPMQKNKILMISRQSNNISIDFEMVKDEILKNDSNINIKILCKKVPKTLKKRIGYCFYTIKCMYHIATSSVCFVEGYVIPISVLKHKDKLIIVQIWHALGAIKKFGKQVLDKKEGSQKDVADIMKMHKNYTFITCASNITKEFYAEAFGIEKEKILVLGMPRIDYLLGKDDKIDDKVNDMLESYPEIGKKKNILYVPTFRKGESTNIYNVINAIDEKKYNLIVRLHPLEKTEIDSKYTISNKYSTFELLKISDYVITDYSAVSLEACTLNKPVFFYLYDLKDYQNNRGLNVNLKDEMGSVIFDNIEDIVRLIENKNYPYEEYEKFKIKYIETLDTKNTERIINHIKKLVEEKWEKKN